MARPPLSIQETFEHCHCEERSDEAIPTLTGAHPEDLYSAVPPSRLQRRDRPTAARQGFVVGASAP